MESLENPLRALIRDSLDVLQANYDIFRKEDKVTSRSIRRTCSKNARRRIFPEGK
jgi:hypothetical protein